MTLAQIRQAIRDITKEWETDSGTLLPTGDALLDRFIEWATEQVTLDLIDWLPEKQDFIDYEDITLIAGQANYTLTAEWLQIWCMQKNVTGKSPRQIDYIDIGQKPFLMNIGETAEHPTGWYLDGTTIYFVPTPSTAATNYARCWMIVPEGTTMAAGGPAYIPRIAHKLIVWHAAILIGIMNERDIRVEVAMYEKMLDKVVGVVGYKIQQQPRFLKESFFEKSAVSTVDPALRDWRGDYFFR
jgi:hypothetical protein